ncbi:MAG: choice-of-anchor tandem repeat GloVer-containing protein [Acidimicrobiales bacterium]
MVFSLALMALAGRSNAAESVLYSFAGGNDGQQPVSGLIATPNGTLYGTTPTGGGSGGGCQDSQGCGVVFSLTPPAVTGDPWTEAILHTFTGNDDGTNPRASLLFGTNVGTSDTLYGTTQNGGASNAGTVFRVTTPF